MKKLYVLAISFLFPILLCVQSFGNPQNHTIEPSKYDLYFGVGAGVTQLSTSTKMIDEKPEFLSLSTGVEMYLSHAYFAGEMNGKISRENISNNYMSINMPYSYGIRAKVGYVYNNTAIYCFSGYNMQYLIIKDEINTITKKFINGIPFGVGLKTKLTNKVSIIAEYDLIKYHTFFYKEMKNKIDDNSVLLLMSYSL